MSRLTHYDAKQKQYIRLASRLAVDNKLGKLEDLEEEIGCPLEVLSKVIENGFYDNYCYIPPSRILRIDIFNKEILKMYYDEATSCFSVKLTDYKKTWFLKKDKSE